MSEGTIRSRNQLGPQVRRKMYVASQKQLYRVGRGGKSCATCQPSWQKIVIQSESDRKYFREIPLYFVDFGISKKFPPTTSNNQKQTRKLSAM